MRPLHSFLILCLLLASLVAEPASAQETPRAAAHDGYGRMVFDWSGPVVYSADAVDGRLVVRFSQPIKGDPRAVLQPLGSYLRGVEIGDDGRTLSFGLIRPVQPRAFLVGRSVVVDLVDRPGPPPRPQVQGRAPQRQEPSTNAPAQSAEVRTRGAPHTGFHRIVFEWPRLVDYAIDQKGPQAVVRFTQAGRLDAERLKSILPPDIGLAGIETPATGTTVAFALPRDARLRHFRSGNGIVVDIVRPADAKPPRNADGKEAAAPLAPSPEVAEPAPAVNPVAPPPTPLQTPADLVEEVRAAAQPTPSEEQTASLTIAWTQPAAAAVFRRAGWLWVVFDKPQELDLATLRGSGGNVITHVEQVPHPDATILRLITHPDHNPSLRRDGLDWILDFARQPLRAATPIEVQRHAENREASLFLPVNEGGTVFALQDPEVGDEVKVIPVVPLGAGVYPGTGLPEVELPATAQGILIVPLADDLQVRSDRTGITVTMPGGFSADVVDLSGAMAQERLPGGSHLSGGALDIVGWLHGGPHQYAAQRTRLEMELGDTPRGQRNPTRLELARLHLANANAPEALSILRVMADEEPSIVEAPAYRALRGAAQFLMYRPHLAVEDLSHPGLQSDPEVEFWRTAARAAQGKPAEQAPLLAQSLSLLKEYPPRLRQRLGFVATEALLAADDEKTAGDVLAVLKGERLSRAQGDRLAYLEGDLQRLSGDFDAAIENWTKAEAGDDRLYRAKAAVARVELELKLGRITSRQALQQLDRMRFAWRGDELEVSLLRRLADLHIETGDFGEGLRLLRQVASNFGQHESVPEVAKLMSDTFERLFLDGAADALPPVTAIAMFDEFRELTPTGAKGDEMIRRLADRLASVDLLDRAAELLNHQVEYRLQGVEKARVATRLALLQLLNRNPKAALGVLDATEGEDIPEALDRQRRQLAAQALSELDRGKEAIARLKGDHSIDARLLRAEIMWRQKNWAAAAATFSSLVTDPLPGRPLDEDSARFILHWATALILGGDEVGVARLRAAYGPLMAATPYRDAFSLLTSEVLANVADYRKVADKIKEAEKFQAFMATYRKRLRDAGLSSLN